MGGKKHKQTKKPRVVAKDNNKKKDPSASSGDQVEEVDPNQGRGSGRCCLPVGKNDFNIFTC